MILLMAALGWPKDGARWEAYGVAVCNVLPVFIGAYDEYVASLGKADQLDGEVRSALGQMVYGIVGLLPSAVGATEHASMRGYTLGANLLSFVPYLDRLALVGAPPPHSRPRSARRGAADGATGGDTPSWTPTADRETRSVAYGR